MNFKKFAGTGLSALAVAGGLAAGIYYVATKDPNPIRVDARMFDDYAGSHTAGLIVVDQWGNMAVMNHTINTMLWGKTGLFVDGVSIPDSAAFQGPEIAKAGPGNRLAVGMCPLIICRDGKPVLGSAATGGGLHAKTLQVLANILDFGMDPQTAVDTPAFVGWGADTFDPKVLAGLKEMELKVEVNSRKEASITRGYWAGVWIDPVTRDITGGATQGAEGGVVGY